MHNIKKHFMKYSLLLLFFLSFHTHSKNPTLSIEELLKRAKNGDTLAIKILGDTYSSLNEWKKAIAWYERETCRGSFK